MTLQPTIMIGSEQLTPRQQPCRAWLPAVRFAAGAALVSAIVLARRPDLLQCPVLTREDGGVFLSRALTEGGPALLTPYEGYFQVLPQLLTMGLSPYTLAHAPLLLTLAPVILAACFVATPLTPWFDELAEPQRWVLTLAPPLLPWYTETLGNVTNLQWFGLYALALLSLAPRPNASRSWLPVILAGAAICVYSAPASVVVLPVILIRLVRERRSLTRGGFAVLAGIALLVVSMVCVAGALGALSTASYPAASLRVADIALFLAKGIGFKVVGVTLLGQKTAYFRLTGLPCSLGGVAFLLVLVGLSTRLASKSSSPWNRLFAWGGAYYILAPVLLVGILRPRYLDHFATNDQYWGADRYFVVPSFFLLSVISLLTFTKVRDSLAARLVGTLLLVIYAGALSHNVRCTVNRYYGWNEHLRVYYATLQQRSATATTSDVFPIPVMPGPPWHVTVPLWSLGADERARIERTMAALPQCDKPQEVAWAAMDIRSGAHGAVDTLEVTRGAGKTRAVVGGWFVHEDTGRRPDDVFVVVDDMVAAPARSGLLRADIAHEQGNPGIAHCGWYTVVDLSGLVGGEHRLVARCLTPDGRGYYETAPRRITVE